jgi:hypothetical protein
MNPPLDGCAAPAPSASAREAIQDCLARKDLAAVTQVGVSNNDDDVSFRQTVQNLDIVA